MNNPESSQSKFEGVDLAGIGKLAKAIPPEVYTRAGDSLVGTFDKLVAPITETTSGFGRYIRQKFDNMIQVEKELAVYSLEQACQKAERRLHPGQMPGTPLHPKSFVRALEEASKETDPLLNDMWSSLLASELVAENSHPHFIEILTHFSRNEAELLLSLRDIEHVGKNGGRYIFVNKDRISTWITHAEDVVEKPWSISCIILMDFGFADILGMKGSEENRPSILYRTAMGSSFIKAATNQ